MFSINSGNSIRKNIFVIAVEGFDPATFCVRDQDATTVLARHVRDRIFELTLVHASFID